MAKPSHPVRLDPEITASARTVASNMSRSLAEQLSHWARIGRELERSPDVSVADVQRVLAGRAEYDSLPERAQAIVRAVWNERIAESREKLRLDRDFRAAGYRYAELDEDGNVVIRTPARSRRKRA